MDERELNMLIESLSMLKSVVEWNYPLDAFIHIDKALQVLQEYKEEASFENNKKL